jgi:hypothetical protein
VIGDGGQARLRGPSSSRVYPQSACLVDLIDTQRWEMAGDGVTPNILEASAVYHWS